MATIYREFDTTVANFLADLRTAITASTDWTRPAAAGFPDMYQATTTRGAKMIVNFADAAIDTNKATIGVWRDHDGTTGTDKLLRYLPFRRTAGGTTANPLHVVVSAGKEHLFVSVEGPYGSEAGTEHTTYGSMRTYFVICDLVPYFDATVDPIPAVVVAGFHTTSADVDDNQSYRAYVSRNSDNTSSWRSAVLASLEFPHRGTGQSYTLRNEGVDGQYYLFPYVVFDEYEGMRGRLNGIFYAGFTYQDNNVHVPNPPNGSVVTYAGSPYKLVAPTKSNSTVNIFVWGPLGASYTYSGTHGHKSVVIAVPHAT